MKKPVVSNHESGSNLTFESAWGFPSGGLYASLRDAPRNARLSTNPVAFSLARVISMLAPVGVQPLSGVHFTRSPLGQVGARYFARWNWLSLIVMRKAERSS